MCTLDWSLGPKAIAYMELFFGGLAKLIQPETCGHMKPTDSPNNIDEAPLVTVEYGRS